MTCRVPSRHFGCLFFAARHQDRWSNMSCCDRYRPYTLATLLPAVLLAAVQSIATAAL